MVIKFSDKFESIFYAVLCANLTGYFLVPQSQPTGLFEDEEFIDIDKANLTQLIEEHNRKFGLIKWFNNSQDFLDFKNNINYSLRFWQPFKYKTAIEVIRKAIKYGLKYLITDESMEVKYWQNAIKLVKYEVSQAVGNINLIPASFNEDKFLLGEFNEESRVGDLVLEKLAQKYFGYNFLIKSSKFIYFLFDNKILILDSKNFNPSANLNKILIQIYKEKIWLPEKINHFGLEFLPKTNLAFG